MWSKRNSPILFIRIHVHGYGKNVRLWMVFYLRAVCRLLFSMDGILGVIRGRAGKIARGAVDSANAMLLSIQEQEPLTLADVEYREPGRKAKVLVRTLGIGREKKE